MKHIKGSTLMLTLWALVLLSAAVLAWASRIDHNLDAANEANRDMEARAISHSGAAMAMQPEICRNSPELQSQMEPGKSYRVSIESEGSRVNVNYLLTGNDPVKIAFFKDYLALKGLSLRERETLTDGLRDWITPSASPQRATLAESSTPSPHRQLLNLDEIPQINGSGPLVSQPGWQEDLTLYSSGPLDLESVPANLLSLVPGIGKGQAERFVKIRQDRLRRIVAKNGSPFRDLSDALACLGLSQQQYSALSGLLGFRDPVLRIESLGQSQNVIRRTRVLVRKPSGAAAQILYWSE